MPGGTSSEGGGRNPSVNADRSKAKNRDSGRKPGGAGSTEEWLALLMANQQQQSNAASIASQAAQPNKFDPAAFLAAKNSLDAAYAGPSSYSEAAAADGLSDNPSPDELNQYVVDRAFRSNGMTLDRTSTADPDSEAIKRAQLAYDQQVRSRRADAINFNGKTVDSVKDVRKQTEKLSWDEYNNLTPLQRAAVDYNTMLAKAVKRDIRMQDAYNPDETQRGQYDATVSRMFGETDDGMYAPETVAVLNQLKIDGDKAGSLQDYVNLDAVVGTKDLKRLDKSEDLGLRRGGAGSPFSNPVMKERMDLLGGLVSATEKAQASALEKGNAILANFQSGALSLARADNVEQLGGISTTSTGLGFGETEKDQNFQKLFDYFADGSQDAGTMLGYLQKDWSEKDRKAFMSYAQKRLLAAAQGDIKPTESQLVQPRTAEEIAQVLQLPGLGKGGATNSG